MDKGNTVVQEPHQHDAEEEPIITSISLISVQPPVDKESYLIDKVIKVRKHPCQYQGI